MATTAEAYGFGARAPYAQPRASEYDMKERVRLSGLFPRVRNEPMSTQLQALMKDFEQNAALTGILERRRHLEERTQYELRGREIEAARNTNLAPPFRAGTASFATSAAVASAIAERPVPKAGAAPPAQDAAAVMTGAAQAKAGAKAKAGPRVRIRAPPKATANATALLSAVGMSQEGGSTASTDPVLGAQFAVQPVALAAKAPPSKAGAAKAPPPKATAKARDTRRSPSTSRSRV